MHIIVFFQNSADTEDTARTYTWLCSLALLYLLSVLVTTTKRGYIFIVVTQLVCFFVSRITQKLLNRFSQNSVESWHTGHGRNC